MKNKEVVHWILENFFIKFKEYERFVKKNVDEKIKNTDRIIEYKTL